MPEFLQLAAQLPMIVDFTVEDDGGIAVFAQDGLVAGLGRDDLQARGAQGAMSRLENSLLVGSAVQQRRGGAMNAIGTRGPSRMGKSNDSTHKIVNSAPVRQIAARPGISADGRARRLLRSLRI